MNQDWSAVGAAIRTRLDELGLTMTELASRSGVSLTTVRELVHVLNTRRRQPRVLASLSTALGWPEDHLGAILRGRSADASPPADELAAIRAELRALRRRVDALEDRVIDR